MIMRAYFSSATKLSVPVIDTTNFLLSRSEAKEQCKQVEHVPKRG